MSGRLVLVRHGQSHANVERRLDTRPPGAALTELGHEQARAFARDWQHPVGLIVHSIALRAVETAAEIGGGLGLPTVQLEGIHEVQVGDLENRNDDDAHEVFATIYQRWQDGELEVPLPGGESGQQVLDRYLPVVTQLRLRHLDDHAWTGDVVVVSHGAAIRLVAGVLAGVDSGFAINHHLANTECVVLSPITDGRWSCVQWGARKPPFGPEIELQPAEEVLHGADPMG
ncbi:MAG: histidine phosphatase family protein [Mycobacterium sp.]